MKSRIPIEENPYPQVYVDLTFKCNMNCRTCYNPWKQKPDLDLKYFEEVCKRIKGRVWFRFIGGEPTVVPDILFKAMELAKKYRHLVSIVTNGKQFVDLNFTKELKSLKIPFVIALSFDGGYDDHCYEVINNMACKDMKLQAVENMQIAGYKRVVLCCTLIRGLNEHVIPDLLDMTNKYEMIRFLHYRSQVHSGKWVDEEAYNIYDLERMVSEYVPEWKNSSRIVRDGFNAPPGKTCRNCCRCSWVTTDLQITLIDAASENIRRCHMRGQLNDDFTLTSFFEAIHQSAKDCDYILLNSEQNNK